MAITSRHSTCCVVAFARVRSTDRMEQAYALLDPNAPLDVKVLEHTVETFYNASGKEEVRHET